MNMKEVIAAINHEKNFDKKCGMLEMFNIMTGNQFGLLAGRVVRFANPEGSTAEKYAHCNDVWAELSVG